MAHGNQWSRKFRFVIDGRWQQPVNPFDPREAVPLEAPFAHTLWDSYLPLFAAIWTIHFRRSFSESAPIKCYSDVAVIADSEQWELSYKTDGQWIQLSANYRTHFVVYLRLVNVDIQLGSTHVDDDNIEEITLEKADFRISTPDSDSIRSFGALSAEFSRLPGTQWDGLEIRGCPVVQDRAVITGLSKVEMKARRPIELRSTKMYAQWGQRGF